MCSAASPTFQTPQPARASCTSSPRWGWQVKCCQESSCLMGVELMGSAGQRGDHPHLPFSVPVNLSCRQRLNQPSVTPGLCQLCCSCRRAKGKFLTANSLLTHLFMPLTPAESQLTQMLEYFLHPAVLQSSQVREFFCDHCIHVLLPSCSNLLHVLYSLSFHQSLTPGTISGFALSVEIRELNCLFLRT